MRFDWKRASVEFVTIVAGVLIALAADDWRESVRDRAAGANYRTRLDAALQSDLQQYADAGAAADSVDSAAVLVLAVYRGEEVSEDSILEFVQAVRYASSMPAPAIAVDTYNDLVTTGNLRLLPIEAREQLGAYYAEVAVFHERELIFRDRLASGYWTVPSRVLGPEVLPAAWRARAPQVDNRPSTLGVEVSRDDLRAMITRLRAIPELEAWIADVRWVMVQRASIYGETLPQRAQEVREALLPE